MKLKVIVTWSCLTLWGPHGPYPARLLCLWNSPGTNTRMGSHSLLQRIFLTQGSNPALLHCGQILYYLSHHTSPVGQLLLISSAPLSNYNHLLLDLLPLVFHLRLFWFTTLKSHKSDIKSDIVSPFWNIFYKVLSRTESSLDSTACQLWTRKMTLLSAYSVWSSPSPKLFPFHSLLSPQGFHTKGAFNFTFLSTLPIACMPECSAMSDSPWPFRLEPARLRCAWNSLGNNTGVVAISSSRGSSWPRDWTPVSWDSCFGRWILYHCVTWEASQGTTQLSFTSMLKWRLLHNVFLGPSSELPPDSAHVSFVVFITLSGDCFFPLLCLFGVIWRNVLCFIHLNS